MSFKQSMEFTKENIDKYFAELSKEYKKLGGRNVPVEIVIIGGAAIVERYGFRNMTTDIDAIIPAMEIMKEAINRVGDKFTLPNGWLNADFMTTTSYSPRITGYSKPYKTFNQVLNVRYISGAYLIAMKLKSGRVYKFDFSDIVGILAEHEKMGETITFDDITEAVNNLYGDWSEIGERAIEFIKLALEKRNYEELYALTREKEKQNADALREFDEDYPGILDENNVDYILNNIGQNLKSRDEVKETLEKYKAESKK